MNPVYTILTGRVDCFVVFAIKTDNIGSCRTRFIAKMFWEFNLFHI